MPTPKPNRYDADAFVVHQVAAHSASYIKLMHELGDTVDMTLPRPPPKLTQAVVRAAHARGLGAVGHAFSYAGVVDLLQAGVNGLTHVLFDAPAIDDWLGLNRAYYSPTFGLAASQAAAGAALQARFIATPFSQRMLGYLPYGRPVQVCG